MEKQVCNFFLSIHESCPQRKINNIIIYIFIYLIHRWLARPEYVDMFTALVRQLNKGTEVVIKGYVNTIELNLIIYSELLIIAN